MKSLVCLSVGVALSLSYAVHSAPHESVRYQDLNLSNPTDAKRLYARIVLAAEHTCPYFGERTLRLQAIYAKCRAQTIDNAVRKVANPQLTLVARQ